MATGDLKAAVLPDMRKELRKLWERERRRADREEQIRVAREAQPHTYVVLGLGMPMRSFPEDPDITGAAKRSCQRVGMELDKIRLTGGDLGGDPENADRWTIRFPNGHRDDERADLVGDHLRCIESVNGELWGEIKLVPVREVLISKHRKLNVGRTVREIAKDWHGQGAEVEAREQLEFYARRGAEHDLFLWTSLPAMQDEMTERAVSFLHESHERAWFANSRRWKMARRGPEEFKAPPTPSEAARLEGAVVSAFKVVEALIGTVQPRKVQRELIRHRFHHSFRVPFPPHRTLGLELEELAKARDARAAHGSGSRKSVVTYYEVMGWQTCAQILANQALRRRNAAFLDLIALLRQHAHRRPTLVPSQP